MRWQCGFRNACFENVNKNVLSPLGQLSPNCAVSHVLMFVQQGDSSEDIGYKIHSFVVQEKICAGLSNEDFYTEIPMGAFVPKVF